MNRVYRPLHDWRRHYPTARHIAACIGPELLRLSSKTLASDICACFRCSKSTAYAAIGFARRAA